MDSNIITALPKEAIMELLSHDPIVWAITIAIVVLAVGRVLPNVGTFYATVAKARKGK